VLPAGFTVNEAVRDVPPQEPVIVDVVDALTVLVVTVNVVLVAPAGMVTLAGTPVAAELSESVTTAPPLGAAAVNVTVPVAWLPAVTEVGLTVTVESAAPGGGGGGGGDEDPGFTVIDANWNVPFIAADSCTVVVSDAKVVTGNVALV